MVSSTSYFSDPADALEAAGPREQSASQENVELAIAFGGPSGRRSRRRAIVDRA
jgi:hypothetical protein